MTIGTQLTSINTTAENIKTKTTEKGQTVETTDSWLQVRDKIDLLGRQGSDYTQNVLQEVLAGTIEDLLDETLAYVRPYCFCNCQYLRKAELSQITKICSNAFRSCYRLETLVLPGVFVKLDNIDAFKYTFIGNLKGQIFVADDLWEKYQTADNWSYYKDIIKPLSQYNKNAT